VGSNPTPSAMTLFSFSFLRTFGKKSGVFFTIVRNAYFFRSKMQKAPANRGFLGLLIFGLTFYGLACRLVSAALAAA
jgi:hypothetical protein